MIKKILLIYLIWLIIINLFAFYSLNRFNFSPDTAYTWINPQEFYQDKNLDLISLRAHWDSFWYIRIAQNGYQFIPGEMSSIAFFPLYPGLIWLLDKFPFIYPILAGWIISTISLGVGLIFLYKLAKQFHEEVDPLQPIFLLLIFPTAFFLNSVYTESLFLTISIIFFYYLFRKNFLIAAACLSIASVCRINGLFLLVPLLFEYFKTYGYKRLINRNLICFLIAPLGIISFMIYQYVQFGEALAFLKSQMEWGRNFTLNSGHFNLITPASYSNLSTDLFFLIISFVSGILLLRYQFSYGLYILITIAVAISTGTLMSISRFSLILFPIFILLASFKNNKFQFGWQLASTLLLAVYTTLFVNNYWAG